VAHGPWGGGSPRWSGEPQPPPAGRPPASIPPAIVSLGRDWLSGISSVSFAHHAGPNDAHFVVCSLLVLGPKYQNLLSMRFCVTETPENRNTRMRNG
jgi:hypothetical protein